MNAQPIGSMYGTVYLPTFTTKINQIQAKMPYKDPMRQWKSGYFIRFSHMGQKLCRTQNRHDFVRAAIKYSKSKAFSFPQHGYKSGFPKNIVF